MYTPQHLQNVEKINLFRRIDMKSIDLKYDMLTDDLFKNTKFTEISLINKTGGHIDLPGNLFYACSPFITALDLSNSSITHIPSGLFDGMIKLTVLRLNGNKIKTFPDNLFDSCSSLVSVFLHNNPFESVPRNLFSKTNNLREVSVDYVNIIVYTMLPNIKKINEVSFMSYYKWFIYPGVNNAIMNIRNKNSWNNRKFMVIAKEIGMDGTHP